MEQKRISTRLVALSYRFSASVFSAAETETLKKLNSFDYEEINRDRLEFWTLARMARLSTGQPNIRDQAKALSTACLFTCSPACSLVCLFTGQPNIRDQAKALSTASLLDIVARQSGLESSIEHLLFKNCVWGKQLVILHVNCLKMV